MIYFDNQKRLSLNQLKYELENINQINNYEYSLENQIKYHIKNNNQFSEFEITNFLK